MRISDNIRVDQSLGVENQKQSVSDLDAFSWPDIDCIDPAIAGCCADFYAVAAYGFSAEAASVFADDTHGHEYLFQHQDGTDFVGARASVLSRSRSSAVVRSASHVT